LKKLLRGFANPSLGFELASGSEKQFLGQKLFLLLNPLTASLNPTGRFLNPVTGFQNPAESLTCLSEVQTLLIPKCKHTLVYPLFFIQLTALLLLAGKED
jgi:hypothetical protein